jgi:predicted nucleic acid-binding protein
MTFVVDASVVLAWCFEDETHPVADATLERLERESAIAPAHWPLEVANALRTAERAGRLTESDVGRVRTLVSALAVDIMPIEVPTALFGVLDVARQQGLTVYDAAYLDLASVRGVQIATIDDRLRAACARAGVGLVA